MLAEARAPRALPARAEPRALPLEGVKVLDLFWVLAGPAATRVMAEYGATVVHVESTRRLDTIRTIPPYKNGAPGPEYNACVQGANAGKLCVTRDLAPTHAWPKSESAPVCSCFGFTRADIEALVDAKDNASLKQMLARTESEEARCVTKAPNGARCTTSIRRIVMERKGL